MREEHCPQHSQLLGALSLVVERLQVHGSQSKRAANWELKNSLWFVRDVIVPKGWGKGGCQQLLRLVNRCVELL
jgi:hypothetical protein